MAAQKKQHSDNQLRGLYEYRQLKECPSCGAQTSRVKESRKVFDGVRRRYSCSSCDYAYTTFEVTSDLYDELRNLRSKINKLQQIFLDIAPPLKTSPLQAESKVIPGKIPCDDCVHLLSFGCSFDIPEAQTEDAQGCNLYQAIISGSILS